MHICLDTSVLFYRSAIGILNNLQFNVPRTCAGRSLCASFMTPGHETRLFVVYLQGTLQNSILVSQSQTVKIKECVCKDWSNSVKNVQRERL